jgi:hypothetical protein
MRIRGGTPRSFAAGRRGGFENLLEVYGGHYEGRALVVPAGHVLVVPEYGSGPDSLPETRHEFPAGTRFRVVSSGSPGFRAVTDVDI